MSAKSVELTTKQKGFIVLGIVALCLTLSGFQRAPQLAFTGQIWALGLGGDPVSFFASRLGGAAVPFLGGCLVGLLFVRGFGERTFYAVWSITAFLIGLFAVLGTAGFTFSSDDDLLLANYLQLPVSEHCRDNESRARQAEYQAAREAGKTDQEIAQALAEAVGLRLSLALRDGWTHNEIVREVAPQYGAYCEHSKSIGN